MKTTMMTSRAVAMCVMAAVLLLLAWSSSVNAEVVLSYDDGSYEQYSNSMLGQAVRFTSPATGTAWNLKTLLVYTGRLATNDSIGLKVWEDNAGAMGSILYQRTETVGWGSPNGAWFEFDLSAANLTFSPGDNFFAGFSQSQPLFAFWDTDNPDGRSWWDVQSAPDYFQVTNNYDALIRVALVPEPSSIVVLVSGLGVLLGLRRRRA